MDRKVRVTEHSQRYSGGVLWSCTVAMEVKHGEVPSADKLHRTVASGSPYDDGRQLAPEGALAENTISILNHAIERETGFGENAKCRMQMAHDHGRGNTLAGNIPQHKEQTAVS